MSLLVALVRCAELHTPADAPTRWFDWFSALSSAHELQLIVASPCHVVVVDLGVNAVPDEHMRKCRDCQENRRIVWAIRNLYSGTPPSEGCEEHVLARIAELEAQREQG